ncbi:MULTISPECIES: hypothetical protein [unclassified Chryseobacterium]|uniref:hypothetical protein n=1 Tax=unclassified Chryseobacterium TaxID=2593645 RepID=UPI003017D543
MNTNIAKVNDSTKLIHGITIDNSIFNKNDIDINTYKYNGIYLENLKLKDLLDKDYRANFIKYLKDNKSEDDDFKSTLISQLLFIRVV